MVRLSPLATLLPLFAMTPALRCQDRVPSRVLPATASVARSCGVQMEDGTLWGLGPDYKARFLDDGMEFTPALGSRAPRNLPVQFRFLAAGRRQDGGAVIASAPTAERIANGLTVSYRRGDLTERYEMRSDGVEQSFVFASLPEGTGDLVVRCAVTTELAATDAGGAIRFVSPGLGGVRVGAVTGVDASGRRAAGAMTLADGVLELSLPAAFVTAATLPLVLDPLIGTTIDVAGGYDEKEPDVAFIWVPSHYEYLVVWSRVFSSGDADIRGQRLDYDASLLGSLIGIRSSSSLSSDMPRAASVRLRGRYVVVWREIVGTNPGTIAACSVDAATGAVSVATQLVAGTDAFVAPDVGGDNAELGDMAVAVWGNVTQARIEGARITVSSTGAVTSSGRTIISSSGNTNTLPSIAQDCGASGLFLIAWTTSTTFSTSIAGLVVTRQLSVRDTPVITPASTVRTFAPDVSGDGLHWVVGYDRRIDLSTAPDVYARWVTFDPVADAAYVAPEAMIAGGSGTDTGAATVLLAHSLLVAYRSLIATTGYGAAFVRSHDQFSCGPCEGFSILESNGTTDIRRVAAAGQYLDAILVWESVDPATGMGDVRARRFNQQVGQTMAVGNTGCGPDVMVYGSCARPGNLGFNLRLEHSEPGRPAFVIMREGSTWPVPEITCGTGCGFLDPFRGWFIPVGSTDAHGNAGMLLPIPSGTSVGLRFQFCILPAGTPGCAALGLSFSRAAMLLVQ